MDWLNVSNLAIVTGKDRQTIKNRLEAAGMKPRRNGAAQEYKSRDAVRAILAPELAKGGLSEDTAQAEQARYKAEKMKIELEKIKGESVAVSEVVKWGADVIGRARSKILAMPGRVAPEVPPKHRAAVVKAAERISREALEELAGLEWAQEDNE